MHFIELLREFETRAVSLAQPRSPVLVGILISAENGALAISFECDLVNGRPKHENPVEMDHAFVVEYGQQVSPMREWFECALRRAPLIAADGATVTVAQGSRVFAMPIFDAVCEWTEEFFLSSDASIAPAWLLVDEADAGMFRRWRRGSLSVQGD